MTTQELIDIVNNVFKINFDKADMQDQILFMSALHKFAEQVKPLTVKYVDKLPEGSTFLFKL